MNVMKTQTMQEQLREASTQAVKRRMFLGRSTSLLGTAAFAKLLGGEASLPKIQGLPELPHFVPKAKRVIYLFMAGGPSHIDLFDYKPGLQKIDGQPLPDSVRKGQRLTTMTRGQRILRVSRLDLNSNAAESVGPGLTLNSFRTFRPWSTI